MGDIDFKAISAAKNSNKFQKTRFSKEKSVEVKLGPMAQPTLVFMNKKKKFLKKKVFFFVYFKSIDRVLIF